MSSQLVKLATLLLTITIIYHETLPLPVSQSHIFATDGESLYFTCGPSNDTLEGISVFLNNNEPSQGIVTFINMSNNVSLYHFRNTTPGDDGTKITCSSGKDEGIIYLTVFYGPKSLVDMAATQTFTVQEGMTFSIPLSIDANPLPDICIQFQNATVCNPYTNATSIEFVNISRNQSGEYYIEIHNNISAINFTLTVEVTYPPSFVNPDLPGQCYPVGTNVTYNCSAVSVVEGNPPPNVTANVTQSQLDTVNLSADAVMILDGKVEYITNIECRADNGVAQSDTAMGSVRFGSTPGPIENIQIQPDFKVLNITWTAQNDTGCPVVYEGQILQLDTDDVVSLFNTTENLHTVRGLDEDTQYIVLLQAVNDLGASGFVNSTAWTKAQMNPTSGAVMSAVRTLKLIAAMTLLVLTHTL